MSEIMLPLITCIFIAFDSVSGNIAAAANHIRISDSSCYGGVYIYYFDGIR